MTNKYGTMLVALLLSCMPFRAPADEAGHHGKVHAHEQAVIRLSPEQARAADLKVVTLAPRTMPERINAPGTVRYNAYRMAEVTTLTEGVVAARHARLGDVVKRGAPLLTLRSTALGRIEADWLRARADYRKNKLEHDRLQPLASDGVVSRARMQRVSSALSSAQANMMAARAALLSHGLSKRDLKRLEQGRDFGRLILRAPIDGVIVNDQAVLGQFVRPGTLLMRIADESTMWVEAHVPPEQLPKIVVGADAWVNIKGSDERLPAKIVTIHHELDPATRTAVVRLQADNRDHRLYPGMFVEVGLQGGKRTLALLLPASAVQRQGTEQIVFVERSPNVYERREVEATPATPELMRIRSGLKSGERVVTRGAFALLSELLKSGFEAHQH